MSLHRTESAQAGFYVYGFAASQSPLGKLEIGDLVHQNEMPANAGSSWDFMSRTSCRLVGPILEQPPLDQTCTSEDAIKSKIP